MTGADGDDLDPMRDTDATRAHDEVAQLVRMVRAIFADPAALEPPIPDAGRRSRIKIWDESSFEDHQSWTVWGANPGEPNVGTLGFVRRIVWRREVDIAPRFDPVRRLQLLGQPLAPTVDVTDANLSVEMIADWLDRLPALESLSESVKRGRALHLDGERYGVEIDDGAILCRYGWWGASKDWMPSNQALKAVAKWTVLFRDWVEGLLDSGSL